MSSYLDFIKLQSLETELLEIKTSSEKIGTFLKGLIGKNTNLDERDWLLVRTNEFKDKYGDWERYFKCQYLLKHPEVCFLSGNEFSPINGKTLTDQVEEYFIALGGKVISPFFVSLVNFNKSYKFSTFFNISIFFILSKSFFTVFIISKNDLYFNLIMINY